MGVENDSDYKLRFLFSDSAGTKNPKSKLQDLSVTRFSPRQVSPVRTTLKHLPVSLPSSCRDSSSSFLVFRPGTFPPRRSVCERYMIFRAPVLSHPQHLPVQTIHLLVGQSYSTEVKGKTGYSCLRTPPFVCPSPL